jgi:hypothetical protein
MRRKLFALSGLLATFLLALIGVGHRRRATG